MWILYSDFFVTHPRKCVFLTLLLIFIAKNSLVVDHVWEVEI